MKLELEVDEAQARAFEAEIQRIRRNGEDPRDAFRDMVDDFLALEKRVFTSHGAAIGSTWPAIGGRAGRASRRSGGKRRYRNPTPLILTGTLYRSLTSKRARYSIRRVTLDGIVVGTSDPVAHLHDQGSPGGKIPQRKLIDIDRRMQDRWIEHLERYLFGDRDGGTAGGVL